MPAARFALPSTIDWMRAGFVRTQTRAPACPREIQNVLIPSLSVVAVALRFSELYQNCEVRSFGERCRVRAKNAVSRRSPIQPRCGSVPISGAIFGLLTVGEIRGRWWWRSERNWDRTFSAYSIVSERAGSCTRWAGTRAAKSLSKGSEAGNKSDIHSARSPKNDAFFCDLEALVPSHPFGCIIEKAGAVLHCIKCTETPVTEVPHESERRDAQGRRLGQPEHP
jgi:hypothetical protein